jgi:DNA primase catalytic subunit
MQKSKILDIAKRYYKGKILSFIADFSKNREVVAKYYDVYGKRPDTIEYEEDVRSLVEKGATSFHCSVELWKDPLALKEANEKILDELRIGWDLLIDIDCKFLDYSKAAAMLIVNAFENYGIKNYGIKFSGGKGFHICLSHLAFPQIVKDPLTQKKIKISNFFPEGVRIIASYLADLIEKELREIILSLNTVEEISRAIGKDVKDLFVNDRFNPYSVVSLDSILISNRHLYRMPYCLHEKTGLISVVLDKNEIKNFSLAMAKPSVEEIKDFIKKPFPEEAKSLLIDALDWKAKELSFIREIKEIEYKEFKPIKIKFENIEEAFCDCIKKILEGMKSDGRKRALFVLVTYLRSLGFDFERIESIVREWNNKNYKPLKESYIKGQLNWFKKQTKTILPPNHELAIYYDDIGILGETCKKFKNPLSYTFSIIKTRKRKKA